MGDWIAHQIAHRAFRAIIAGLAAPFVVAFLAGAMGVPQADAMAYTFYISILVGFAALFPRVRAEGPTPPWRSNQ